MRTGSLTEIIEIQKPVIVKSETGTETTTYETVYRCRAAQTYNGGDRQDENGDIVYTHNVIFEIRRFYGFDERHRIVWKDQNYRIICIEKDRHNQSIRIVTELINE